VPGAKRVAVVSTPDPQHAESLKLLLGVAPGLGLEIRNVLVRSPGDLDRVFTEIGKDRADAVLVQPSPDTDEMRGRIIQLAERQRLPSIFAWRQDAEAGGLMSYGADLFGVQTFGPPSTSTRSSRVRNPLTYPWKSRRSSRSSSTSRQLRPSV